MRKYTLAKRVTTVFIVVGLWLLLPTLLILLLAPDSPGEPESGYAQAMIWAGAVFVVLGFIMRIGVWQNSRAA